MESGRRRIDAKSHPQMRGWGTLGRIWQGNAAPELEAKNRAKGDAQVVVRAVIKIHFIPDIEANADRSKMSLQPTAWVENPTYVIGAQAIDAADESSDRGGSAIEPKINEAAFEGDEGLNRVTTDVQSRPEFTVQSAKVCARQRDRTGA
jgi:hypothetical protein